MIKTSLQDIFTYIRNISKSMSKVDIIENIMTKR